MKAINTKKIAEFLAESVEWLIEEQVGCCHYKLDDHLAVCVGWSAGYGNKKRDDVIQGMDEPDFGIDVGLKVWTSDALMLTDYDWINFPYKEDGDVLDMGLSVSPNADYEYLAKTMLEWYDEVKDFELSDDGLILWRNEV